MKRNIIIIAVLAIVSAIAYLANWAWLVIKLILGGGPRGN